MIARNTSPPTTPPAIAPALDFDLLADVDEGVALGIVVAPEEDVGTGVLVLVLVLLASDD